MYVYLRIALKPCAASRCPRVTKQMWPGIKTHIVSCWVSAFQRLYIFVDMWSQHDISCIRSHVARDLFWMKYGMRQLSSAMLLQFAIGVSLSFYAFEVFVDQKVGDRMYVYLRIALKPCAASRCPRVTKQMWPGIKTHIFSCWVSAFPRLYIFVDFW